MANLLLIRGARQLVTLRGSSGPRRGSALLELGIIPDGALLIRNGVIEDVGPSRRLENLAAARGAAEIDATGKLVMPMFVDLEAALVHAQPAAQAFQMLLGRYDSMDPEEFRELLGDRARALCDLSARSLRQRACSLARHMLRQGTGTVECRAGYPLDEAGVMKVLRVHSELEGKIDVVSTLRLEADQGDVEGWARRMEEEVLPGVRKRRTARFIDLEYDPLTFPLTTAQRLLRVGAALGLGLKVHAGFYSRSSAIPLAVECGALSVGNILDASPAEIDRLAGSPVIAIVTPGAALQRGASRVVRPRELIDAGVALAMASGYHAELSPGYNMHLMVLLACRLHRIRPEEAISATTINAAHAAGVSSIVGSLETHKQADLQILNVSDYHELPYLAGGGGGVHMAIKGGDVVFAEAKDEAA